jgi:carboxyl-terminal processing protease
MVFYVLSINIMNAIWNFMKTNYKVILVVVVLSATLWSFIPKKQHDPEKDKMLIELISFVIDQGHYNPAAMDDKFSASVYKEYIDALDPTKRFFLESDINDFKVYETRIDDMIRNRDLTFFNLTYERLQKRINEAKIVYRSLGTKPFDFSTDETINIDSEKLSFAKNYSELKNRWRLQIKLSVLSSVTDKLKMESDKKLKNPKYKEKSLQDIEQESRESSLKSLDEFFDFVQDLQIDDWFVAYINAIVTRYDPHTFYFAPEEKEKFDISMSGKLEGIGARLQKKNEYTEITELISGGPASRSKELEPGDIILKVAQGNKEAIDVVGMRIDDVVKKIKGKRGTEVRLYVKKVDGTIKIISLIRDIVEIEETYAKSSIIEKDGKKFGVIYLPKFYIDFENEDNRDAAKDVAAEVAHLKAAGVDGIVMDLRDDGGGSLKTVVDITGLFIKQGPVVQISTKKNKEILYDRDPAIQWDGPLVVMINNFSASASEIFAAAIQDYKRGIILGSKQSYGKGTVQNVMNLNEFVPKNNPLGDFGALKISTQKFYRINGGSTQLEGVSSDIVTPDRYSYIKVGERSEENAMPWDKIDPAPYEPYTKPGVYDNIIANSKKRIAESPQFKLIDESAKWIDNRKDDNIVSLNMEKFRKEQNVIEETTKKFKAITKFNNHLNIYSLPYEVELIKKDTVLGFKRKEWHESLKKDPNILEAINVLTDMNKTPSLVKNNSGIKVKKDKIVKS